MNPLQNLPRHLCRFVIAFCFLLPAHAQEKQINWNVTVLDKIIASVPPGEKLVKIGDMEILVSNVRAWRNELAGEPSLNLAFAGAVPTWTGGNLYYTFDANVSSANRKVFLDAANEWATFANVHFIPRTAQANYFTVIENPSLNGGQSAVGMVGGQQFLQIGPTAWNRATICHELGHTLGLVHEHQRSDRDSFVTILTQNIAPGQEGNFVKLSNSQNHGPYDFLSVMHYSRNTFSVDPNLDTIQPVSAYSRFIDVMGQGDPLLTPLDRSGMAAVYGAGPALGSDVTNTSDSGPGSLRAALYYGYDHPGTTITFHIPTSDPGFSNNVFNILPTDRLPGLWNATVIDGGTEPTNSNPNGPEILLSGSLAQTPSVLPDGVRMYGTNCSVRSLVIDGFAGYGILIDGTNATGNSVLGCFIGTDPTGEFAVTNGFPLVGILDGATSNFVGGTTASERNVISGSTYQGLVIRDPATKNNFVRGNYIGLNAAGTAPVSNAWAGVTIFNGAQSNVIGGTIAGAGNVISGNGNQGISMIDAGTRGNRIEGNFIGLNPSGTAAIPNGWAGVDFFGGANLNIVGGTDAAARNVISGNTLQGIAASGVGTDGNVILGNFIGVNPVGNSAISNGWAGVNLFDGPGGTIIGGTSVGAGNVISGNGFQGIAISGSATTNTIILGNTIGLNSSGSSSISNTWAGVEIFAGAKGTRIGGATSPERNTISGNGLEGIVISGGETVNNFVQGNFIGVNPNGDAAIPNRFAGISIFNGAKFNLIGGTTAAMRNVISGNGADGVTISEPGTSENRVEGNFIGLNASGTAAISNAYSGVAIYGGARANVIGGGIGARNFLSGNHDSGIAISGSGTDGNLIQGNTIGLDAANNAAVPNLGAGIVLFGGVQSNQIGGLSLNAANIIASNASGGVSLFDAGTTNNSIRANSIFGNEFSGIALIGGANRSIAAPSLTSAALGTNLAISGSVDVPANSTMHVDFYSSLPPLSAAQGKTFIGSLDIFSSSGGATNFSANVSAIVSSGQIITATVTDADGNTSPFSGGVAVAASSSVSDGIPDSWRALYFGGSGSTTNAQSCATCDPDNDGADNFEEFFAGTNPTNAASLFLVTATSTNHNAVVTWNSSSGIVYRIESRDDLNTNAWSILADQISGTGSPIQIADPAAANSSRRFYRGKILQ